MIKHWLMPTIGVALWGSALADVGNDIHSTVRAEVAHQLAQPELWHHLIQEAMSLRELEAVKEAGLLASLPEVHSITDDERDTLAESLETTLERLDEGAARAVANSPAFHVDNDNGVLFQGTSLSGSIPAEGGGVRMMWYPAKAAFRAGYVAGTQWNDSTVGDRSAALGTNTTASGFGSLATGTSTTASGDYSTATGASSNASGYISTAMGYLTRASGSNSTAIGIGTLARSVGEISVGSYNTDYTPASETTWSAIDRLFVIGKGTSSASRTDALVMLKSGNTTLNGTLSVTLLPSGGATDLCVIGSSTLATCSSSERYKDHVEPLPLGLAAVEKLKPVSFQWKDRHEHDLGFVAEEVAAVDPVLATYKDGQIEGVKYKQLTAVLVNAVKEQQAQIEQQKSEIAALRAQLAQYDELAKKVAALEQRQALPLRVAELPSH